MEYPTSSTAPLKTFDDYKEECDRALFRVQTLEKKIDELVERHEEELLITEQQVSLKSRGEILALREALLLESALTDRYRDELNIAVSEYTSTTNKLKDVISEDKVKFAVFSQVLEGIEAERKDESIKYSDKLDKIKKFITATQQCFVNTLVKKIEFTSKESLFMIRQLEKEQREKNALLKK